MQSILIEYFRFDNLEEGSLSAGKKYILTYGDLPAKEVSTSVSQIDLLRMLSAHLRYSNNISKEEKWKTIVNISDKIKELFIDISGYSDCQLDTVLNASELGVLPFELLLDEDQVPYFTNPAKKITFTRRIRQDNFEIAYSWPTTPKVLFIYSHGGSREVPFDEHLYELDQSLKQWGGKDNPQIFKMLAEPTFEEFAAELKQNDLTKYPYTHVHILAHGDLIIDKENPFDYESGIVLGKGKTLPTPTSSIKELFESLKNKPFLVSYMICDGANFMNPLKPDKNPVQVTHKVGVPIVLGSQFPLSMEGSTIITKGLYSALFSGYDVREILNQVRINLFKKREEYHDWISLVCYVRLPEGYFDYLYKISLHLQMQKLKYIRNQTDEYLIKRKITQDEATEIFSEFSNSIMLLERKLSEIGKNNGKKYEAEILENMGLLGSAYKRVAELHFIKNLITTPGTNTGINDQKAALEKSLEYYKKACQKNLSHHWSTVQYLSLDLVLNGKIGDMDYCSSARRAINNLLENNPDSWAYGSLLELLLIWQNKQLANKDEVLAALENLIQKSTKEYQVFPLESTYQQIDRYRTWWTEKNGFHINPDILVTDTGFLDELLTRLKKGINDFPKSP